MGPCLERISRKRRSGPARTDSLCGNGSREEGRCCVGAGSRSGGALPCRKEGTPPMLPKRLRAPLPALLRVRAPIVYASPFFTVKARRNILPHNRFGVVIGTSVDPRSTRRHSLKRALLGCVRQWAPFSSDFVFILARPAARLSKRELRAELNRAREKAVT